MKKLLIFVILVTLFSACVSSVLDKKTFKVVDTLEVSKSGLGSVLGYNVVIKYNKDYYSGYIDKRGNLAHLNFKPLKCYCDK